MQKGIQQTNFTEKVAQEGNSNTIMFFSIEEVKETVLDFSQATVKLL